MLYSKSDSSNTVNQAVVTCTVNQTVILQQPAAQTVVQSIITFSVFNFLLILQFLFKSLLKLF